jgi:hypothetical protein
MLRLWMRLWFDFRLMAGEPGRSSAIVGVKPQSFAIKMDGLLRLPLFVQLTRIARHPIGVPSGNDITGDCDIKLANGWGIAKDFGNLTHGYCLTSYSSPSKGVDCTFVADRSESFRAAGREQFYVSASRFKESLTIYTDDKRQLLDAVRKLSHRPSATDLVSREISESADKVVSE